MDSLILLHGEVVESPRGFGSRDTDIVALSQGVGDELAAVGGVPLTSFQIGEDGLGDVLQTLHCGSDDAGIDVALVDVNANDLCAVNVGRFNSRSIDAAAAGKDDLSAIAVPAFHLCGDGSVRIELTGVGVVARNFHAELLGGVARALEPAVAVTDNSGNCHAAEEAELGVAVHDDSVASQITGLLFGKRCADNVLCRIIIGCVVLGQIACANVDSDEVDLGVLLLLAHDGPAEQIAGHDDDIRAFLDRLINGDAACIGGVLGGLIVGVLDAVGFAVRLDALPGCLVEGFVVDGADVGHERDLLDDAFGGLLFGGSLFFLGGLFGLGFFGCGFGGGLGGRGLSGRFGLRCAGDHAQNHNYRQKQSKDLFHVRSSRYVLCVRNFR